jgi:hypothetical protein
MCNTLSLSLLLFLITITEISCQNVDTQKMKSAEQAIKGSFEYDLNFLKQHDSVIVLSNEDEPAKVIVSPKYQAKVFTSTEGGNKGNSFGWINYKAFTAPIDPHMNAYGGENRFWLGPEGGVFSLYFRKGSKMVFDNWKTPAPIDTEPWNVVTVKSNSVHLQKEMELVNYAGTELHLTADREISIRTRRNISDQLGIGLDDSIGAVGYHTVNRITNKGSFEWNEKTGMPCIWMLDMFNPSPKTTIVIPYKTEGQQSSDKIATTDYFGEIPAGRIKYSNGVLLFKADGESRGKLGLGAERAKPIAGSWDAENGVLTITLFDVDPAGKYLNQEWNTTKPVFSGDAVNAYNDGPLEDGTQMGPFYEIESVSPAAFLQPGSTQTHNHDVFHFTGNKQSLDLIAQKILGITLIQIEEAFK